MRWVMLTVLSGLTAVALAGCETLGQKAVEPAASEEVPAVVKTEELPAPQMKGEVFRVWMYGNGEMMALLGTKDGVQKGDVLLLTREGDPINAIEVLNVQPETFFGRVFEKQTVELLPRVGDFAVRPPPIGEPEGLGKPEAKSPEKPGAKPPEKSEAKESGGK